MQTSSTLVEASSLFNPLLGNRVFLSPDSAVENAFIAQFYAGARNTHLLHGFYFYLSPSPSLVAIDFQFHQVKDLQRTDLELNTLIWGWTWKNFSHRWGFYGETPQRNLNFIQQTYHQLVYQKQHFGLLLEVDRSELSLEGSQQIENVEWRFRLYTLDISKGISSLTDEPWFSHLTLRLPQLLASPFTPEIQFYLPQGVISYSLYFACNSWGIGFTYLPTFVSKEKWQNTLGLWLNYSP